jgi:hypothetical protein
MENLNMNEETAVELGKQIATATQHGLDIESVHDTYEGLKNMGLDKAAKGWLKAFGLIIRHYDRAGNWKP